MDLRDHSPIVIDEFNGLWRRGKVDTCPLDHFSDCNNVEYDEREVKTREGLDELAGARGGVGENVIRMYNYKMQTGESLLLLDSAGDIYHALLDPGETVYGPILSISGMTDFGFVSIAGRAYITPFGTFTDDNGKQYQKGLEDEFLYVYKGDGTAARKASAEPPTDGGMKPFWAYNGYTDGLVSKGVHVIGITWNGGPIGPEVLPVVIAPGDLELQLANIPLGPGGTTVRKVVMTRAIDPKDYTADISGYTFYEALTINDNITENAVLNTPDSALTVVYSAGAGTTPTTNSLRVDNTDDDGHIDFGLRVYAVVYETDTGYLSAPGPENFAVQTAVNTRTQITIAGIPVSPDSFVTKRHIVATKAIPDFNGDPEGYQFFFVPDGTIENNVDTTWSGSFFDSDLLDDASHLIDNFAEIPAGVALSTYQGRLVLGATFDDISVVYLSEPGEPEAINQIDGLIIIPLDGRPVTAVQEFRDVLYCYKQTRTYAYVDNGDVPSSWVPTILDQGIGSSVHGICTVLDSGGVNIDYLFVTNWAGVYIFNGAYVEPELSWKISSLWEGLDRDNFDQIQIVNDTILQRIYMTLPDYSILYADYTHGLDAKSIKWAPWTFKNAEGEIAEVNTIALIDTNTLAIGMTL